jgi:hypothetical protein
MDSRLNVVLSICILGVVIVSFRWAKRSREWPAFSIGLVALGAFVLFLNYWFGFPFRPAVVTKGGRDGRDMILAGALGICMVAGMLAQFVYRHFEREKRYRKQWDWGLFIAPIFASPIVFIPLAASFQNVDIDLTGERMTLPRLMIFFVAFENGFFWKEYFDHKRKDKEKGR